MLQAVNRILEEYQSVWEQAPEMLELQAQLEAFEAKCITLFTEKARLIPAYAVVKEANWQTFADMITRISGLLKMHAYRTKNTALAHSIHLSKSDLKRKSSQALLAYAHGLNNNLDEHRRDLASHSEQAALFKEFKAQLEHFMAMALAPSDRRRKLGECTQMIARLQQEIRTYLETVADSLMLFYRDVEPDFYRAWHNARIMPKYRGAEGHSPKEDDPEAGAGEGESLDPRSREAFTDLPEGKAPSEKRLKPSAQEDSPPRDKDYPNHEEDVA